MKWLWLAIGFAISVVVQLAGYEAWSSAWWALTFGGITIAAMASVVYQERR